MKRALKRISLLIAVAYLGFFCFIIWSGLASFHQRWEIPITPTMASIMFTAGTVLIGIALSFLVLLWRTLRSVSADTPLGEPRVKFRLGDIKDKRTKADMEFRGSLVFVMLILAVSILCNLIALQAIVGTMLNFPTALSSGDELKAGGWALLFGTIFFVTSLFLGGLLYATEAILFIRGRPSSLSAENIAGNRQGKPKQRMPKKTL